MIGEIISVDGWWVGRIVHQLHVLYLLVAILYPHSSQHMCYLYIYYIGIYIVYINAMIIIIVWCRRIYFIYVLYMYYCTYIWGEHWTYKANFVWGWSSAPIWRLGRIIVKWMCERWDVYIQISMYVFSCFINYTNFKVT